MADKASTKKIKIVLAEDDKFISLAYKDGLTRAGFDVVNATDGAEAIKKIKAEKPDIILLDIIMPEKNGFEVLEEIKKDPATKGIPAIILSNLGQDSDIKRGKDLGADDYFVKANLSMAEVVEKVSGYFKSKKS
jgi:DNA-binding response OmpR family regulator